MKHSWKILLLLVGTGCNYQVVPCDYVFLLPQGGLDTIAEAKSNGECRFGSGKAPTEYRLERKEYNVSFSIGDRWYPQLMIDVKDKSGKSLAVDSDHVLESHGARRLPEPILVRGRSYRYFVRPDEIPDQVLMFQVRDANGAILGSERVPFELRKGTSVAIDSL
jgi:hypothetical protein